jgi:hypothetical protein
MGAGPHSPRRHDRTDSNGGDETSSGGYYCSISRAVGVRPVSARSDRQFPRSGFVWAIGLASVIILLLTAILYDPEPERYVTSDMGGPPTQATENTDPTDYSSTGGANPSSSSSVTRGPSATGRPSSSGAANPSDELDEFVRDCEAATTFREGQVSLPKEMLLRVGQSDSYSAAVDVRTKPAPPEKVIDSPSPRSEPIKVQCVLSARLVPVSDGVEVVPSTDADGDGWRTVKFTPNGVVEWSWTVKAVHPVDQRLRLELLPAVKMEVASASTIMSSNASYITIVRVDATEIEKLSHWFSTQWKLLAGVAAIVGAAFLAVLAFSSQAKEAFLKLFKRNPAEDTAAAEERTPSEKQRKKGKKKP